MYAPKIIYFIPLLLLLISFSFSPNVNAQSNTPPDINYVYPDPGTYWNFSSILFTGGAIDAEDGVISNSLQWSSNISGYLGNGSLFYSQLPVGDHIITVTVTDSGGLTSTHSVSVIKVVDSNLPPVVTINSPSNGDAFVSGDPVTFQGSSIDDHDGNISNSIFWVSNIDGSLGSGASYTASNLSVGVHTIKAESFDSLNSKGQRLVFIEITNVAQSNSSPTVSISSPSTNSSFSEGQSVSFSGSASDPEQGSISSSIQWTSSIDGSIGTGSSFSKSNLSVGVHTITATVTDSGGLSDSAEVPIRVGYVQRGNNVPPTVEISLPPTNSSFNEGESVSFWGSASDPEQGAISSQIQWTSSIDGSLGTGPFISTNNLSVGIHIITASITDNAGLFDSEQITITVNSTQNDDIQPTVSSGSSTNDSDSTETVTQPIQTSVTITSPDNNEKVKGKITFTVDLSGFEGLTTVKYIVDDKLISTTQNGPYETSMIPGKFSKGQHTLVVEVSDANNFATDSIVFRR